MLLYLYSQKWSKKYQPNLLVPHPNQNQNQNQNPSDGFLFFIFCLVKKKKSHACLSAKDHLGLLVRYNSNIHALYRGQSLVTNLVVD